MQLKNLNGRKARMLLVYPDYTDRDSTNRTSGGNYSEGLASISAVLKEGGHSVGLLHLLNLHTEEMFKKRLREAGEFDIIGFSVRTTAFPDSQMYIKWTKEVYPDVFIICGSYHVTLVPDEVLAVEGVDCVCIGDGEYAELELCDKMSSGEDYTNIESLYFKMPDGSFKKNPIRPLFADLDRIPIPDFDLFDFDNLESSKVGTAIVVVSRGCFYNCTYCGNGNFRKVYPNKKIYARFRSPENAILYLKTLLSKHPYIKFINFRDAIFNMFPDWFDRFIEMYKNEIGLPCTGNIRFDILTEETVKKMKECGFYTIDMGLESGDQEMRFKYLRRYQTDDMIIRCSNWFHKYGISQLTYNIIGLPFEDIHRALKTIKLNARIKSDRVIPNIFYPYEGTPLYDISKEAGFIPEGDFTTRRVPLVQPQFPEEQVLFIEAYFMHFVRRYKWAFAMPRWLGVPYEKFLDVRVTGRFVPYKLLVKLHDGFAFLRNKLKDFLVNHLPKLYVKLRVLKHRKRAKDTE
ncbi:MAG: B12-binding domain-containing radical SAM protein [Clostridia bacterium]|nr:B12-binding domain-containing radical SAM protein [Clostridia bacterium]